MPTPRKHALLGTKNSSDKMWLVLNPQATIVPVGAPTPRAVTAQEDAAPGV